MNCMIWNPIHDTWQVHRKRQYVHEIAAPNILITIITTNLVWIECLHEWN